MMDDSIYDDSIFGSIYYDMIERQPGLWCLTMGHLTADMITDDGQVYGWWCTWCGTAAYDPDRHDPRHDQS